MARNGLEVREVIDVRNVDAVRRWVEKPVAERPVIVAAGGDGTVGSVVGAVADTGAVMAILPLGTSNDVARTLGIPLRIPAAARLLTAGKVGSVDVGRFTSDGRQNRFFVHAAAMGLSVEFAKLATQAAVRRRLGHFTYAVAGFLAMRRRRPFACELGVDGRREAVTAIHVSVINAPVFGGGLHFSIAGSNVDDRRLDVLVIEDMPVHRAFGVALALVLRRRRLPRGAQVFHVPSVRIHSDTPQGVILDGELAGRIPGDFHIVAEGLRIIVPPSFEDIDDDRPEPVQAEAAGRFGSSLRAIRRRVSAGDRAIFQAVTRRHCARLDRPMARVSQAADRGMVWLAVSAVLAAVGGRRGRRAAVRGLATLTVTSGIVNIGAKSLLRRGRPAVEAEVGRTALRPVPASFSFPSGHTASAFAYAGAAGLEFPALIPPLGALALAIGISRVYVGAHYPTDVAAGAAIGVGIAAASTAVAAAGSRGASSG